MNLAHDTPSGYSGRILAISRQEAGTVYFSIKPDILAADPFSPAVGWVLSTVGLIPGPGPDPYSTGPDEGLAERIFPPQTILPGQYPDNEYVICGQDLVTFSITPDQYVAPNQWDATYWNRPPTSYLVPQPGLSYLYKIHASGILNGPSSFDVGIQITHFSSSDNGQTWAIESNGFDRDTTSPFKNNGAAPRWGISNRPSLKVFQLGVGSFLYCWVNPYRQEVYVKASASDTQSTGGTASAGFFFPHPTSFIAAGGGGSPILSSSFVFDGTTVFFFSNRYDGGGVDLWYYSGGSMFTGSISNVSGKTLPLYGGDFINAFVDTTSGTKLYVMVGSNLVIIDYTFAVTVFQVNDVHVVPIDTINYDPIAELQSTNISNQGALAWLTGKVDQAFGSEPDYSVQPYAVIVGTSQAIYIVSGAPTNIVEIADFDGLSVAGALQQLIQVRGYQMLTGPDQDFVTDPTTYIPSPLVTFKQRLVTGLTFPYDWRIFTEACEDGLWLLNYNSVAVTNSNLPVVLGPIYNLASLTDLQGHTFTVNQPRFPGSSSLVLDNRYILSQSFALLLANYYAQDFLVPQQAATIVVQKSF